MVPLYALLLTGLAGLRRLLAGRAAGLERKYVTAARRAEEAARLLHAKGGNGKPADPLAIARRQFELGRLVQVRDRRSDRYMTAQGRADAAGSRLHKLTRAKGRAVPYLLGLTDAGLVAAAAGKYGVTADGVRAVVEKLLA
jgi:hypothetical protein